MKPNPDYVRDAYYELLRAPSIANVPKAMERCWNAIFKDARTWKDAHDAAEGRDRYVHRALLNLQSACLLRQWRDKDGKKHRVYDQSRLFHLFNELRDKAWRFAKQEGDERLVPLDKVSELMRQWGDELNAAFPTER